MVTETLSADLLFKILDGMLGASQPSRLNYTPKGAECVIEYKGIFYRIAIEPTATEPPKRRAQDQGPIS